MQKILFFIWTTFIALGVAYADTETVRWYINANLYDTTTCQSGGDVNLPTAPTKRGYTFNGWTSGIYDMSTIDTSINGTGYEGRNAANTCWYRAGSMTSGVQENCTNDRYAGLDLRQWRTHFSYGTVYGEAMCSDTAGQTMGETGHPAATTSSSKQCWCKVTGFIPTNSDILYDPAVSLWAFLYASGSASECASNCAPNCGSVVRYNSSLRAGLFGSVAN